MSRSNGQSEPGRTVWTVDAVKALGLFADIVTAGSILGIGRTTSYQMARDGRFPVKVVRLGRQYRVSVTELLEVIGADQ